MNIFVLDFDKQKNVRFYFDKHVVKMITEHSQILSTVNRLNNINEGYKITHKNHPCVIWARKSLSNWIYLYELNEYLHDEYRFRYGKHKIHKAYSVMKTLNTPNIQDSGLTNFALAMPDIYKRGDVVNSYRNYYMSDEKRHLREWKNRDKPYWFL